MWYPSTSFVLTDAALPFHQSAEEKELIDERAARSSYLLGLVKNTATNSQGDIGTSDESDSQSSSTLETSDSFAKGTVLIAHPMQGGFFTRSVILLFRHDQYGTAGAMS